MYRAIHSPPVRAADGSFGMTSDCEDFAQSPVSQTTVVPSGKIQNWFSPVPV